jgi:protein-tyrosine phosphatase
MIDIHCHVLPELDDGPADWATSLQMARMAVEAGTHTIIATPHQLGQYRQNVAAIVCSRVAELNQRLQANGIALHVLPGGDVRIEADLVAALQRGDALTLGNRQRHVLLELPHELYFPMEPVLAQLHAIGLTGILSHPERNRGILAEPAHLDELIEAGCLMQVTAGSLLGAFGTASQRLAEEMIRRGQAHFVASDGHGTQSRRPRMRSAFDRIVQLVGTTTAQLLCSDNPRRVCEGQAVPIDHRAASTRPKRRFTWPDRLLRKPA